MTYEQTCACAMTSQQHEMVCTHSSTLKWDPSLFASIPLQILQKFSITHRQSFSLQCLLIPASNWLKDLSSQEPNHWDRRRYLSIITHDLHLCRRRAHFLIAQNSSKIVFVWMGFRKKKLSATKPFFIPKSVSFPQSIMVT